MLPKKYSRLAIITLFLAIIMVSYFLPAHTTHAQVISNIINQIVNTVAPSTPASNTDSVIITPAAVDVPVQTIAVPVPSVSVQPSATIISSSSSPVASASPRPTTSASVTPRPTRTVIASPSPSTTTASTTATTTATTTQDSIVGTPNNTITGSASNYYVPLNNLSPVETVGLSILAIFTGIYGAFSILKTPSFRKPVVTGGYSQRNALPIQEPLLDQQ